MVRRFLRAVVALLLLDDSAGRLRQFVARGSGALPGAWWASRCVRGVLTLRSSSGYDGRVFFPAVLGGGGLLVAVWRRAGTALVLLSFNRLRGCVPSATSYRVDYR